MQHELLGQYFARESTLQSALAASRTGMALCTARFSESENVCRRLHSTWLERPDRPVAIGISAGAALFY